MSCEGACFLIPNTVRSLVTAPIFLSDKKPNGDHSNCGCTERLTSTSPLTFLLEHLYRCAASGPHPFGTLENRLAGSLFEEFLPFGIFIGVFKQSAKVGSLVCGCGPSFFASKLVDLRRIGALLKSQKPSEFRSHN